VKHGESLIEAGSFSAVELFRGLRSSQLRQIKEKSEVREYDAGHIFFRPGEEGEALFLLERGCVQTFRQSGTKKLIIADLKPPAVFGEIGRPAKVACPAKVLFTSKGLKLGARSDRASVGSALH